MISDVEHGVLERHVIYLNTISRFVEKKGNFVQIE